MSEKKLPEGFDWRAITPDDSPMTPMDVMASEVHQNLSSAKLQEGDPAFFFTRPQYDFSNGTKVETGDLFDLAAACTEKPVALIFGSYT
jgi:hypothetical protein